MQVSKFGRQGGHLLKFLVAIGFVVLFLVGMGVSFMEMGRVPRVPHWLTVGVLVWLWGSVIWDTARRGRLALLPWQVAFLLGATLYFGSDLVVLGWASWVKDVGWLIFMLGALSPWLQLGRHPSPPSVDAPADEISG